MNKKIVSFKMLEALIANFFIATAGPTTVAANNLKSEYVLAAGLQTVALHKKSSLSRKL